MFRLHAWLFVLPLTLVPVASIAQERSAPQITVRSYNTFGLPIAVVQRAQLTARGLLNDARIRLEWRSCGMRGARALPLNDDCEEILTSTELVVRIVAAPRSVPDTEVLGYSHVDQAMARGTLATVFADRVEDLAARLHIDKGTLLGRAIAHEVGHLLLGTLMHSQTGVMRGRWSAIGQPMDWVFSPDDAARMRDHLAGRSAAVLAVTVIGSSGQ